MFKDLRDRLNVKKHSPSKLQASVQQFSQAVFGSTPTNSFLSDDNSMSEKSAEDRDTSAETLTATSDYDSSFTTVDLKSPTTPTPSLSRRLSSSSSITGDLFLTYDFTPNRYNLQSDLESNSEFDDSSSTHQFNNVSKELLYEKFCLMQQKYHKYRGRFVDLKKYCAELQRENNKAKNILTETQDKAIRRIQELREQCNLEQQAKAHLEDALRNELEERDHIIDTLNTKIELLKNGKDCDQINQIASMSFKDMNSDNADSINAAQFNSEREALKDKIKNYEQLFGKAKEGITEKNNEISELKTKIELDNSTYLENMAKIKNELSHANERIQSLESEINIMKKKEEDALLSLAENKLTIHKELETKENQIKNLSVKISEYEQEIKKTKSKAKSDETKPHFNEETPAAEPEEIRLLKEELLKTKHELEEMKRTRNDDLTLLKQKDSMIDEFRLSVSNSNEELQKLKTELNNLDLQGMQRKDTSEREAHLREIEQSQNTIKKLELSLSKKLKEFNNFRAETELEISKLQVELREKSTQVEQLKCDFLRVTDELAQKRTTTEKLSKQVELFRNEIQSVESSSKEKDEQIQGYCKSISELEKQLSSVKNQHKALVEEANSRDKTETNLKADKIVLDELLKNTKNELSTVQSELKTARNRIKTCEDELRKANESAANEFQKSKELQEKDEELRRVNGAVKTLQDELEEYKQKEENALRTINRLTEEINNVSRANNELRKSAQALRSAEQEAEELKLELKSKDDELRSCKEEFSERVQELENKITELNEEQSRCVSRLSQEKQKCQRLLEETEITKEKLVSYEVEKLKNREETDNIACQIETLKTENIRYKQMCDEVKVLFNEVSPRLKYLAKVQNEMSTLKRANENMRSNIDNLENNIHRSASENKRLQEQISKLNGALRNAEEKLENLLSEDGTPNDSANLNHDVVINIKNKISNLKGDYMKLRYDLKHDLSILSQYCVDYEAEICARTNKSVQNYQKSYTELENQLKELTGQFEVYKNENSSLKNDKKELLLKVNDLSNMLNKLEKSLNYNAEEEYQKKLQVLEESFNAQIKEVTLEYERNMMQKEKEYEDLQDKLFMRTDKEEAFVTNENKQIIQNLQEELVAKNEAYESLLENHRKDVQKLNDEQSDLKSFYTRELREADKKWRLCLDKKLMEMEEKYKEEINELAKEWSADRKQNNVARIENDVATQTLENSANQSDDVDVLRAQVQVLSNELSNCKKAHRKEIIDLQVLASCNNLHSNIDIEDCTEMEYLRNILYEYMMGKQPMILAKVLAAVVKFDNDQTKQILQREEQKLSLLGQLGFT